MQRWTWTQGAFNLIDGKGCLSRQADALDSPAVVTAACTDLSTFYVNRGILYRNTVGGGIVRLSPVNPPIAAGTLFRFTDVPPTSTLQFSLVSAAVPAQGGMPASPAGFTLVPSNDAAGCLSGTPGGPRVLPCVPGNETQRWTFEEGQLRQGTTCLTAADAAGVTLSACLTPAPTTQVWYLGPSADIFRINADAIEALFNNNGVLERVSITTPNRFWALGPRL